MKQVITILFFIVFGILSEAVALSGTKLTVWSSCDLLHCRQPLDSLPKIRRFKYQKPIKSELDSQQVNLKKLMNRDHVKNKKLKKTELYKDSIQRLNTLSLKHNSGGLDSIKESHTPDFLKSGTDSILKRSESEASLSIRPSLKADFNIEERKNALLDRFKIDSGVIKKSLVKVKAYTNDQIGIKGLNNGTGSANKKKIHIPFGLGIGYGSIYIPKEGGSIRSLYSDVFSVSADLQLGKIPLHFDLSQRYNSEFGFAPSEMNLFKFGFDEYKFNKLFVTDRERLKGFLKNNLQHLSLQDYTKRIILNSLNGPDFQSLADNDSFLSYFKNTENVNTLLELNDFELKEKLKQIEKKSMEAANVSQSISHDSLISKGTLSDAKAKLQARSDSIFSIFSRIRAEMKAAGLNPKNYALYKKFLSGEHPIESLEDSLGSLDQKRSSGKLYNLLSRIKKFEAGSFSTKIPGDFGVEEQVLQGVNLELRTHRGPLKMGFGSQSDASLPKDWLFNSSSFLSPKSLSYLSIGTNSSKFSKGSLSWIGSANRPADGTSFQSNAISRNSMAFTVSQTLKLKDLGSLKIDLSKSVAQYRNSISELNENIYLDKSVLNNYFSDQLLENLSIGFSHSLEVKKIGFSNNFYFSSAGFGYQNPVSAGTSQLRMRLGGVLKQTLFSNKLILNIRGDLKNTPLSSSRNGAYWQNHSLQFDSRLKLNKRSNISVKLMENGVSRIDTSNSKMFSSNKLSTSFSSSYHLGKKYAFSYIDIGFQRMQNTIELAPGSSLVTVNYTQSIIMNRYTINGSVFYNRELSAFKLIGNMTNAELGCQYPVFKKIQLNSSVTYLDNEGLAHQVGLRQGCDFQPSEALSISLFGDLRKNIITPVYPSLYPAGRAEFAIKYYLKNN